MKVSKEMKEGMLQMLGAKLAEAVRSTAICSVQFVRDGDEKDRVLAREYIARESTIEAIIRFVDSAFEED